MVERVRRGAAGHRGRARWHRQDDRRLAVAGRLQDDFADGAVFVDLSPVPPGADITRAVAEAAGVEGTVRPTRSSRWPTTWPAGPCCWCWTTASTCSTTRPGSSTACWPGGDIARILATSREPLGVAGEHVWPLGPLHDEGPALFVERARAAEPRGAGTPPTPRWSSCAGAWTTSPWRWSWPPASCAGSTWPS